MASRIANEPRSASTPRGRKLRKPLTDLPANETSPLEDSKSTGADSVIVASTSATPETETTKKHRVAKCRWCGGQFVRVYGWQWLCENEACAERQVAKAVRREHEIPHQSPFLFLPLPFQVDIEDHPVKRLLVHGAAGVSKSYFGRWYAYKRCMQIPGFRVLLLRNTYDQLNKNHLQYMDDEAKLIGLDKCKWTGGNVRQMKFFHDDKPEAVMFMGYCQDEGDIAQHVGPEWDLVILEEGVTLLPKAIREITARDRGAATSRPYREPLGVVGQTRILTNPGGRAMNYLDDFYIAKAPDPVEYQNYNPAQFAQISGSIEDNPYLDEDYRESNLGHLDRARHAQLASGRWDVFEGQFFTSFDPTVHVVTTEAA